MRPTELHEALIDMAPTRLPAMIEGPPGGGKSSIVRQVADELFNNGKPWARADGHFARPYLRDIRAVLTDPVDWRGLPHVQNGKAIWAVPDFLPTLDNAPPEGILFLDELPNAPLMVQSACLQLTLDRSLGEYHLPDGWWVIAAGNRVEDRAGAQRLISSLGSRLVRYSLDVSLQDWLPWAVKHEVHHYIRSYLKYRPAHLMVFDPALNETSFPCPRTWEMASTALKQAEINLARKMAADNKQYDAREIPPLARFALDGTIGKGHATEFCSYVRLYKELPDPRLCVREPETAPIPKDPSAIWALCGALTELGRKASDTALNNIVTYARRLTGEFTLLLVRDLAMVNVRTMNIEVAKQWLEDKRDIING